MQLNFLHITITDNGTNSYDFKIFRIPAIASVQVKWHGGKLGPSAGIPGLRDPLRGFSLIMPFLAAFNK